jgi:hypothetical protein
MFMMLVPRLYMAECTQRVVPGEWSDAICAEYPKWHKGLPVLVCEGTGHLSPLVMADEHYAHSTEAKAMKKNEQVTMLGAASLVLNNIPQMHVNDLDIDDDNESKGEESGTTMTDNNKDYNTIDFPLQPVRRTTRLIHNPRKRPNPFYRRITEIFPMGMEEEVNSSADINYGFMPPPTRPNPGNSKNMPSLHNYSYNNYAKAWNHKGISMYSYRKLHTVIMNHNDNSGISLDKRPSHIKTHRTFREYSVNLLHFLEKKSFMGLLPNLHSSAKHKAITMALTRQLPPKPYLIHPSEDEINAIKDMLSPFVNELTKGDPNIRPQRRDTQRWVPMFCQLPLIFKDKVTLSSQRRRRRRHRQRRARKHGVIRREAMKLARHIHHYKYIEAAYARRRDWLMDRSSTCLVHCTNVFMRDTVYSKEGLTVDYYASIYGPEVQVHQV